MPTVRILDADHVRTLLDRARLRVALEAALVAQSEGLADVPPRIAAAAPNGLLAAMPGYLAGSGGEPDILGTKLVAIFPGNVDTPSHQGVIAYFDPATGTPLALMDAEVITEERTAGTAAIATDLLARPDARILTIVGAGAQGRAHVAAFGPLRPWSEIRIVSRSQPSAAVLAADARFGFGADVVIRGNFDAVDDAVDGADVVALCTHADQAVIDPQRVAPGAHVSSVGSQAELPIALLDGERTIVVDHVGAVTTAPPAGAAELQHLAGDRVLEIGRLIVEPTRGRQGDDSTAITIYKSTGHAVQDLAASKLIFDAAVDADIGTLVRL